ncbi:MAG: hypothetical protein IPI07_16020 [Flavobacteriales bacterium]|nr:hypothetical protein [Flavobacteriales bacterium]
MFARFEAASGTIKGVECWSARELQTVLGYAEWRNFTTVVDKAREACEAAGEVVTDHFVGITKWSGARALRTARVVHLTPVIAMRAVPGSLY